MRFFNLFEVKLITPKAQAKQEYLINGKMKALKLYKELTGKDLRSSLDFIRKHESEWKEESK